ncbi:MAG: leucyl aminopeptidase [Halioglobus sp.]|jgi:leucyl aminopeptidase
MSAIKFNSKNISDAANAATACAVVPIFGRKGLSEAARQMDKASMGAVSSALKLGDFTAAAGETLMLSGAGSAKRLLLVGCGSQSKFDRAAVRKFISSTYAALNGTQAKDAIIYAEDLTPADADTTWMLSTLARKITSASYRYSETLAKPKSAFRAVRITVCHGKSLSTAKAQNALDEGKATGLGMKSARKLADLPGNICTPSYLADQARALAKGRAKFTTQILEEKEMAELGMGALLSVSAGSDESAKLIVMNYKGGKSKQKPYVLVGKGITFDTGGISLKPGSKMDEMKYDMGGAASVFGTMEAIAEMNLPLNVVGIVAAAENMPSGGATKPGDVVTSMSGKTIEILNTDAEGRLVLCDALTYAERFEPLAVIDIATLTGACVVALGAHATGLYANQDQLADQLLAAGTETHDRAWRMPLWDDYQRQLNTNFADVSNLGGPGGGSITAACFLSRFAQKYHWAHMDIAGTAWNSAPKGATGRPVPLLTRYLMDRAGK